MDYVTFLLPLTSAMHGESITWILIAMICRFALALPLTFLFHPLFNSRLYPPLDPRDNKNPSELLEKLGLMEINPCWR